MATASLTPLKSQLHGLRQGRAFVRVGTSLCVLATVVLSILAAAFVVDVSLELPTAQRAVSLIISAGIVAWAFQRYVAPAFRVTEDEIDLALMVEKQQGIRCDLVSALQFDTAEAAAWGSPQLEQAVIGQVAEQTSQLNVFEGFSYDSLRRHIIATAVLAVVLSIIAIVFPSHTSAFLNRFLLGSAHYPTDTVIEELTVNGELVELSEQDPSALSSPYGKPIVFRLRCSGVLPDAGTVTLVSQRGGVTAEVPLEQMSSEGGEAIYAGTQPRLIDTVSFRIDIGDAWTDPILIAVVPLPVVNIDLNPQPPKYALAQAGAEHRQEGTRHISVLEGSHVELTVSCANKSLQSALLRIEDKEYSLVSADETRRLWKATNDAGPLQQVSQPLQFEVEVIDEDGLSLESPIRGMIGIRPDQPPRVAAGMISKRVIPSARPKLAFGAIDDYGISRMRVRYNILHADGTVAEVTQPLELPENTEKTSTTVRHEQLLELESLKLVKGDQLRVTVEAFDHRGDMKPKSNQSEPMLLEVTDREGILSGLLEIDEKSARRLDAIIERELGIGETQ